MENVTERALARFRGGFNCSQSVLSTFCEKYDLDEETAMKLASPLGGGAGAGEVCGAVTGALLVIGLKYGQYLMEDAAAKLNCRDKAAEFTKKFREKFNSLTCRDLLGIDTSLPGNREIAEERNLFRLRCDTFVAFAVETLAELGY